MKYILSLIIGGALVVSGFGQTRNVLVGTNNAVIQPTNFWSADAVNARAGLGLGTAATNDETSFQPSSATLSNFSAGTFTIALSNGGTGATNASGVRTNLGLGTAATNPATAFQPSSLVLSNLSSGSFTIAISNGGTGSTNASDARTALGLGTAATNPATAFQPSSTALSNLAISNGGFLTNLQATNLVGIVPAVSLFGANTNPVLVNTNGEVVSPTNFWQVAPITTTFIESQPTANQTTNMPAGRNLHIHSLAISTVGVTNTIALPTTGSFNGDIALVVHEGPTSSVTAVRQAGAGTNLVTLNQFDEAVEFVYYNNVWQFNHNRSFIEPIYFSGTNAAANAAASRTNLGLGATWLTNNNVTNFRTAIGLGATNSPTFAAVNASSFITGDITYGNDAISGYGRDIGVEEGLFNGSWVFTSPLGFDSAAVSGTRTNLGLPLPALTNTNNANFRDAIELGATNNVTFNNVTASGTLTATGVVTTVTNLNVGGAIAVTNAAETRTNLGIPLAALTNTSNVTFQSAVFTTNAAPTNTANVNGVGFNTAVKWMEITLNIGGTNQVFRIPLFQ
jgi:hypothetical protein